MQSTDLLLLEGDLMAGLNDAPEVPEAPEEPGGSPEINEIAGGTSEESSPASMIKDRFMSTSPDYRDLDDYDDLVNLEQRREHLNAFVQKFTSLSEGTPAVVHLILSLFGYTKKFMDNQEEESDDDDGFGDDFVSNQ